MTATSERRESFFRCTYSARGLERTAHVRAWDADEAETLFRAELDADGVSEKGTVDVVRVGASAREVEAAARARIDRRRRRRLDS